MEPSTIESETLKAIYRLSGADPQVKAGPLAEALDVSPATITARVRRLHQNGLADHTPYHGVSLTKDGRRMAVAAIRRHRIVERFLSDMLGYSWERADALAVAFEHALPNEVVSRLFVALDRPASCPHGFPIPEPEADDMPTLPRLTDLADGETAEVAVPGDTHPDVIAFLAELGVRPGVTVEVRERHPFDGPIVVSLGGEERTLGNKLARQIYVRTVDRPRG
jgi:DtxR family transcriptional regulator, Mn-dependent transcriptional regulator